MTLKDLIGDAVSKVGKFPYSIEYDRSPMEVSAVFIN